MFSMWENIRADVFTPENLYWYIQCVSQTVKKHILFQINGYDITHLPRYEAVQKFLQAKETLVVELCRQKHNELDLGLQQDVNAKLSEVEKTVPNALQSITSESDLSALIHVGSQ